MGSERRMSSSARSRSSEKTSKTGPGPAPQSQDDAFYEECRSAFLSTQTSINQRILSKQTLYNILVNSGRAPSKAEMSEYWPENTDYMSYLQFCSVMRKCSPLEKGDIQSLFNELDSENDGLIDEKVLFIFLTEFGESLSPNEKDQLSANLSDCIRDGKVDFVKFANKVFSLQQSTLEKHSIKSSANEAKKTPEKKPVNEKVVSKLQSKILPKLVSKWSKEVRNGYMTHDGSGDVTSIGFRLDLSSSNSVIISTESTGVTNFPNPGIDVFCACIKLNDEKLLTDTVYVSDITDSQRFHLKADLPAGSYLVIPFTFSSDFLPRESEPKKASLTEGYGADGDVSEECRAALESLFQLVDIDGDNSISRDELNMFQLVCTGEHVEDEDWSLLQEMWEVVDECITGKGFQDLHRMEALNDPEGLWNSFEKMGFNHALQLDQACPLALTLYLENDNFQLDLDQRVWKLSEIEKKLVDMSKKKQDKSGKTKTFEDVDVTTYKSNQIGLISISNNGRKPCNVKLGFSKSTNLRLTLDSSKKVEVDSNSKKVVQVCVPEDASKDINIKLSAEI